MTPIAVSAAHPYASIGWLLVIVLTLMVLQFGIAHAIGPRRRGPVKDTPFEAGVDPVGSARHRFDVRFYMVAVLFLLFDVEVALLWPWAPLFADSARPGDYRYAATAEVLAAGYDRFFLLWVAVIFALILLVGYVYAWRKGAFRFS